MIDDKHLSLGANELTRIADEFSRRRVLVVGDHIADQFVYGEISRISREAPVLILRHERTETVPGGAANCALNLAALGAHVRVVGTLGADAAGDEVRAKLVHAGIDCERLTIDPARGTPTKARVLAGGAHSTRQQVIRIDYDADAGTNFGDTSGDDRLAPLIESVRASLPGVDACIVSDYNYGVAHTSVIDEVRRLAAAHDIPAIVDSRFRLGEFEGFDHATPNEDEVEGWHGSRLANDAALEAASVELRRRLGLRDLLVTRGKRGMLIVASDDSIRHLPSVGSGDAVDVTGAGDTVIAAYALALASGASTLDAARLANHAGGIVVMKRGTAVVAKHELVASIRRHENP